MRTAGRRDESRCLETRLLLSHPPQHHTTSSSRMNKISIVSLQLGQRTLPNIDTATSTHSHDGVAISLTRRRRNLLRYAQSADRGRGEGSSRRSNQRSGSEIDQTRTTCREASRFATSGQKSSGGVHRGAEQATQGHAWTPRERRGAGWRLKQKLAEKERQCDLLKQTVKKAILDLCLDEIREAMNMEGPPAKRAKLT